MTSHRRARIAVTAVGGLLGLTGVTLVGVGLIDNDASPTAANTIASQVSPSATPTPSALIPSARTPSPSAKGSTTPRPKTTPKSNPDQQVLPESVPTAISIPAIDVDTSRFVDLSLMANGQMEAPVDPDDVGWFTGAHTPGSPGVSVLAGHVTWNGNPSAFFKLGKLERADTITIKRKDGSRATFEVTRMATFPKDEFPTAEVYKPASEPELVLITCGGEFDADKRYYDSNVIVWAKLVRTVPA